MKKSIVLISAIIAMATAQTAMAGGDRNMEGNMEGTIHGVSNRAESVKDHGQMQGDMNRMKDMFLVKRDIDGFVVSFHAMQAKEGMQHGGSHNFMVKIEKDGKALTGLVVNSKVIHPDGKAESKMMMKMGDWHMAGYDLDHEGTHQLMVLFKAADGKKHFVGVRYPGASNGEKKGE